MISKVKWRLTLRDERAASQLVDPSISHFRPKSLSALGICKYLLNLPNSFAEPIFEIFHVCTKRHTMYKWANTTPSFCFFIAVSIILEIFLYQFWWRLYQFWWRYLIFVGIYNIWWRYINFGGGISLLMVFFAFQVPGGRWQVARWSGDRWQVVGKKL